MYIWILLATIMVALSFFNVSPRADKEHALNDIKAATVVNRFKAEHAAMLKNFNCEILFRKNNQSSTDNQPWDYDPASGQRKSAVGAVDVSAYNPAAVEGGNAKDLVISTGPSAGTVYTKMSNHLPIGYETAKYNLNHIHHLIFCLKKNAVDAKNPSNDFTACDGNEVQNAGHQRYLVSFAQINDRWISHDDHHTPLPTLVNLLSKAKDSPAVFGWTDCTEADNTGKGCVLRGMDAFSTRTYYSDETDDNGNKIQKVENIILPEDAIFWQNEEFINTCVEKVGTDATPIPCLFAYEPFPIADTACRCWNAMHPDPAEKRFGDKCHPADLRWDM